MTATEYGLIAGLISMGTIFALQLARVVLGG